MSGKGLVAVNRDAPLPVYDSERRPHPFVEELIELFHFRDLLLQWTVRNITLRYKRSSLGVVWTLLEPLMLMIILSIVFSALFKFSLTAYPVYLLAGLIQFDFLSRSTTQMMEEIVVSQSLSTRVHLPRSVFGCAAALSYLVNWLVALLPLVGVMLVMGHPVTWLMLIVPVGMALTALFALGVGLVVATLGAFFHDIKVVFQVLLTAWLYATPIIYPLEIVPESYRWLLSLNPLYHLVRLVRDPIYFGQAAAFESWLFGALAALLTAAGGWWVFTHWRSAFDYRV